ncbi:MAG TPA: glycosyltransferase [Candidatus Angelobacter sp.]|nr:glycosyltransferase [Candidatus Angelobacter sp.]
MIATDHDKATQAAWGPDALRGVREARRKQQEGIAAGRGAYVRKNRYFYDKLKTTLRYIVEPGKRVLELRCETGHLLAAVEPAYGVGVEISDAMVRVAQEKSPSLHFVRSELEDFELNETFDYIIFSHIFDTVDILRTFERIRAHSTPETQVIVMNYNQFWEPVLELASKLGLRARFVEPNWVSENDVRGFLKLAGLRPVRKYRQILFPKWIPLISNFVNGFLARLPGVRRLCMMQIMVARPMRAPLRDEEVTVSVIVPCRNEVGNVEQAVNRVPKMGRHTEILFCDDKSTDGTLDEVRRMQELHRDKDIRLIEGPGICKAENVWTGFRAARGDVLMILDADLTVMPEELPMFASALTSGRGDFVNGSRLVYPRQENAMRFSNMIGNKFFGLVFSFLLDQRIKDTLCGTKVLWKRDWQRMERNLGSWGIKDLWGDYELLFGASKLHLETVEVPVHYQERIHGVTKMTKVFANGWRMLKICFRAWYRLGG